jgi:hypothetical protein
MGLPLYFLLQEENPFLVWINPYAWYITRCNTRREFLNSYTVACQLPAAATTSNECTGLASCVQFFLEEKRSKIAPLYLHPLVIQFPTYANEQLLQGVHFTSKCKWNWGQNWASYRPNVFFRRRKLLPTSFTWQFYIPGNGTVYLHNRYFQKNEWAAIQTYRDGNPSNKILI